MRKAFLLVLMILLVVGCDSRQKVKKYQGVKEKTDYKMVAENYLAQGDIVKAIQNFDQAIKQDPQNVGNYLLLGQVYMQFKQYARAVDTFVSAVRVDPVNGEAYYFTALSKALQIHEGKEPPDAAIKIRKEAVVAAEKSLILFKKQGNKEMVNKAAVLLKSLLPTSPDTTEEASS